MLYPGWRVFANRENQIFGNREQPASGYSTHLFSSEKKFGSVFLWRSTAVLFTNEYARRQIGNRLYLIEDEAIFSPVVKGSFFNLREEPDVFQ